MTHSLMLLIATAVAAGDTPARPVTSTSTFPRTVRPAVIRFDTTSRTARFHQEAARRLERGDVGGARSTYVSLIAYLDSTDTFPGEAMWALATLEWSRDRELRTAAVLDQLAESAARYGRAEWRARALLEAGLIYQRHGQFERSTACAAALRPLLSSPAISEQERAQLRARVSLRD